MADISQLNGLLPVDSLDLDNYKTQSTGTFVMPKAGRYTVQSPESFPASAFSSTKAGFLSIDISPRITGPSNENFQMRYVKISAKPFERQGTKVSQVGDYLRAVGYTGKIPGDPQELANLVEQTAGAQYEVILDWEARHSATGFTVKGMTSFPKLEDGSNQQWTPHPTEKDAEGNPLRVRANLVVRAFVPKVN